MSSGLDGLLKNDGNNLIIQGSKKFQSRKRMMKGICHYLTTETRQYLPKRSVDSINKFLNTQDETERLLYSGLSNYIFSLDLSSRGMFATNIEKLLLFALNETNAVEDDCKKIIIKIYDHSHLALYQIENVNNILDECVEDVRDNLRKEIKGIEKEYISILGIFAAIVLAFVGGITFSSSVLQNISGISIYRLLLIVDLLAFVLLNVMYLLVHFIFTINNREDSFFKIKSVNGVCLGIAVITVLGWLLNVQSLAEFFSHFLPWSW